MINLSTKDQPRLSGKLMELIHQSTTGNSHIPFLSKLLNLLPTERTGATLALREPTGAPKRKKKILMRGPRDNKDSCLLRETKNLLPLPKRRTGVIEESRLTNGAIKKSSKDLILRLSMINLSTRDQPRLPGKLLDPVSPHQLLTTEPITLLTQYYLR